MGSRQQKMLELLQQESERDPTNTESEAHKLLIRIQNYTRISRKSFISVDSSDEYEKVFPGYSYEAYNLLVPQLAEGNWVRTWYDSTRDGPYVELTPKALELLTSEDLNA
jgi:hypothetical protein